MHARYPNLIRPFPPPPRVPWVKPEEFLDPQLQNLFQLSYFDDGSGSLPCGWQVVTEEGQFPRLSTRQPKPASPDVDMRSPGPWDASDDTGSEGQGSNVHEQTRMADESDDDSDPTDLRVGALASLLSVYTDTPGSAALSAPSQPTSETSKRPWKREKDEALPDLR
jgi:hypothetical protein